MSNILSRGETAQLKSMSRYWAEVHLHSQDPLTAEVQQVCEMLGARLLRIVSFYVNVRPALETAVSSIKDARDAHRGQDDPRVEEALRNKLDELLDAAVAAIEKEKL